MIRYFLLLLFFGSLGAMGQAHKGTIDIGFHGYVGVDVLTDSRVSKTSRNRHIYLYPLNQKLNEAGEDLNKRGQFDVDAAHSRIGVDITGLEFNGIKANVMMEADFLGESSGNSYFRLRHAFVRFTRKRWSLLAGQYWHPLYLPEYGAGTVNGNAGAPFHPLNRSPQIQLAWESTPTTRLLFFLVEQNNFRSTGFSRGTEESMIPEVDLQFKWLGQGVWAAFTAGFKTLAIPETLGPTVPSESVRSMHYNASFRYQLPGFTFKLGGTYGGNLTEMVMLGGVGKTSDNGYKPMQTGAVWFSLQSNHKAGWQPGFFAGYTQNLGASSEVMVIESLSREPKIASVYAISPRLRYIFGSVVAGAEWLWTTAEWGETYDSFGVPKETQGFVNHRILLSLRYNF